GLARIDSARGAGLHITADQYPYTAAATSLAASIPAWAHSGGTDSLVARLRDPAVRADLHRQLAAPPNKGDRFMRAAGGPAGVLISAVFEDSLRPLQGKRLSEVASARHQDGIETLFDIAIADHARTGAIYFIMNEPDVQAALKSPLVAVNTDAGGVAPAGPLGAQGKLTAARPSRGLRGPGYLPPRQRRRP